MQLLRAILLSLSLTVSLTSSATTLDFNELSAPSRIGAAYSSGGFLLLGQPLTSNPFSSFDQFFVTEDTGSPALIYGRVGAPIDLRSETNSLFDAISIDLARGDSNHGLIPVGFTGTKENGVKVFATYWFPDALAGRSQKFAFGSEFVGLKALDWSQGAEFHQFDNIVVSATAQVPEPSTIWLLASSVMGLLVWSRKRTAFCNPPLLTV